MLSVRFDSCGGGGGRINGDYADDDDNKNETAPPTAEDEGEVSLPMRLLGVSLSGWRTTRFILRLVVIKDYESASDAVTLIQIP